MILEIRSTFLKYIEPKSARLVPAHANSCGER